LTAMVPAFEGFPLSRDYDDNHDHCWNVFVQRILQQGYLLPGTINDLGRDKFSWIVKWPENDGFKSTAIFNNLQYAGCNSRTINDIPPIEFHPESSFNELAVIMTSGEKYTIGSSDLETITCLTPGVYSVREARSGGRNYDLVVEEFHINSELSEAMRKTNQIVGSLNVLAQFGRKAYKRMLSRKSDNVEFLYECKGSGRLTRSIACLNQDTLAVAYKIEGRKITTQDSMRTMTQDIRETTVLIGHIERRLTEISNQLNEKRDIIRILEEVKSHLTVANKSRIEVGQSDVLSDEPISKVLYPGGGDLKSAEVWNDYTAWYTKGEGLLQVDAKRHTVSKATWLSDMNIEVSFFDHALRYFVTPLEPVAEGERGDEIQEGDIAILAGRYLIIAEVPENSHRDSSDVQCIMTNYLRVTNVEEQNSTRRGRNRLKQPDSKVRSVFR